MIRRLALSLCIALSLTACWPAALGVGAGGGYYVGQDRRTINQMWMDGVITGEINSRLIGEKDVSFVNVDVDTYNGEVTLNGAVGDETERQRVIELAREVRGVTAVVPNLQIAR